MALLGIIRRWHLRDSAGTGRVVVATAGAPAVEESKFVCKFWRFSPLRPRFADKLPPTHKKVNLSTQSIGR